MCAEFLGHAGYVVEATAGCDLALRKPCLPEHLLDAVRWLLETEAVTG